MSTYLNETSTKPIYSIPSLIELNKEFDKYLITGAYAPAPLLQPYPSRGARKNITDSEQTDDATTLQLYYLSQQIFNTWKNTSKYTFLTSTSQNNLTLSARKALNDATNRDVSEQGIKILDELENQLQYYDTSGFPSIQAAELEDGRLILEWVFDNFRVGFNLELSADESGYFLVSDKNAGEIRTSSYLKGLKLSSIIQSALILVINN